MPSTKPRTITSKRARVKRIHDDGGVPAAEREEEEVVVPRMPRSFDFGSRRGRGIHEEGASTVDPFNAIGMLGCLRRGMYCR